MASSVGPLRPPRRMRACAVVPACAPARRRQLLRAPSARSVGRGWIQNFLQNSLACIAPWDWHAARASLDRQERCSSAWPAGGARNRPAAGDSCWQPDIFLAVAYTVCFRARAACDLQPQRRRGYLYFKVRSYAAALSSARRRGERGEGRGREGGREGERERERERAGWRGARP